jgi:predicted O-methyltransferase YrrM
MQILLRLAARSSLLATGMVFMRLSAVSSYVGSSLNRGFRRRAGDPRLCEAVSLPEAFPAVDLAAADPIAEMLREPAFQQCAAFFSMNKAIERALVSPHTQALLFTLVRNLRPEHVIEIGTYKASTTEAICRALYANNKGTIHTVDPHNIITIFSNFRNIPQGFRRHLCFYPTDSMDFYNLARRSGIHADVVFIDGNHEYEFALFDIESAARLLHPGGFVVIDNVSQAGPYFAARDFLKNHPQWSECGHSISNYRPQFPFDPDRTTIFNTDACVLRAPATYLVEERPTTAGQQVVTGDTIDGVSIAIAQPATGTLYAQCVVRVFGSPPTEATIESTTILHGAQGPTRIALPWTFRSNDLQLFRTAELWLSWHGHQDLPLNEEPQLF